jgi:chemotaxis response regulator CheB
LWQGIFIGAARLLDRFDTHAPDVVVRHMPHGFAAESQRQLKRPVELIQNQVVFARPNPELIPKRDRNCAGEHGAPGCHHCLHPRVESAEAEADHETAEESQERHDSKTHS